MPTAQPSRRRPAPRRLSPSPQAVNGTGELDNLSTVDISVIQMSPPRHGSQQQPLQQRRPSVNDSLDMTRSGHRILSAMLQSSPSVVAAARGGLRTVRADGVADLQADTAAASTGQRGALNLSSAHSTFASSEAQAAIHAEWDATLTARERAIIDREAAAARASAAAVGAAAVVTAREAAVAEAEAAIAARERAASMRDADAAEERNRVKQAQAEAAAVLQRAAELMAAEAAADATRAAVERAETQVNARITELTRREENVKGAYVVLLHAIVLLSVQDAPRYVCVGLLCRKKHQLGEVNVTSAA